MKCSVEGCSTEAKKAGMCGKHYLRKWRHGDPSVTKRPPNGTGMDFVKFAAAYRGDECLTWPHKRRPDGYAVVAGQRAHRLVCQLAHGDAQSPLHEAAHSCGKGHLGCVNPKHLYWATHSQNMLDKIEHGTDNRGRRHPMSKLTERDVREIRSLCGRVSQREIARRFGLSPGHVSEINTRKTWGWLA